VEPGLRLFFFFFPPGPGHTLSLALAMDLQAKLRPLVLHSTRRVIPNCPSPSTLPTVYPVPEIPRLHVQKLPGAPQEIPRPCWSFPLAHAPSPFRPPPPPQPLPQPQPPQQHQLPLQLQQKGRL